MHRILVTSLLFLLAYELPAQDLKTIEVAEAYKDRDRINLSTFAESIEYIQLETSDETLYSYPTVRGIQGDSIILVKSMNRTSIFNRKTGSFIRDIGHIGQDPDSYQRPGPLGFNTDNGNVFVYGYRKIIEYSLASDKVVHETNVPDLMEIGGVRTTFSSGAYTDTQINMNYWSEQGYFVGLVTNLSGKDPIKVVLFSRDGQIIKFFENKQTFEKKDPKHMKVQSNSYYEFDNAGYHKEYFSDTTFQFNSQKIQPKYVFNTGKYSPPYKRQDFLTDDESNRLMFIKLLQEDSHFVYFELYHQQQYRVGLFNKKTNQTLISDPESDDLNGFYNDLDNFVPFIPSFRTQEGYLVGTISAENVYTWFQSNRSKANKLPEHLKRFKNIDPEDNPIVMIVKPKN
ncbi:6-bladed beta-propeller [Roseivirga spongicola]|uniref:6-bladed beta-propeller n=1 Tax=Roseivirga spongicola TaxID=333140 RepID=UPI002AC9EED2|nr:6-bladed beta-propeller [Roseivirga spongicola]WPZ11065.1 6-bladed beta-propeller [Roseivirga spongicola]